VELPLSHRVNPLYLGFDVYLEAEIEIGIDNKCIDDMYIYVYNFCI